MGRPGGTERPLADELAAPRNGSRSSVPTYVPLPRVGVPTALPNDRNGRLCFAAAIREQRLAAFHDSQTLVWLDGEALAVTPACCNVLPHDELAHLAYELAPGRTTDCETRVFITSDGRSVELARRRTVRRFGRLRDVFRGRRWTAPESRAAADLLRRERSGEPAQLLAFGQRERSWGVVESFLLRLIDGERRGK